MPKLNANEIERYMNKSDKDSKRSKGSKTSRFDDEPNNKQYDKRRNTGRNKSR